MRLMLVIPWLLSLLLETQVQAEVSFKGEVLPVLMKHCALCHQSGERYGYLTIDEETSYLGLVNIPAYSMPSMKRVEPGKPEQSYFWLKMTGEHLRIGGKGWPMPYMGSLKANEKQAIYDWIVQGAKNN